MKKTPIIKTTSKPPVTPFKTLVQDQRKRVVEWLQLGGDFPQCNEGIAITEDWIHILVEGIANLTEHCRFDESDPTVNDNIRQALARIAATCLAWDEQLSAEE